MVVCLSKLLDGNVHCLRSFFQSSSFHLFWISTFSWVVGFKVKVCLSVCMIGKHWFTLLC